MNDDDEIPELETTEYPPWREAVKLFLAEGFKEGEVVPHEWFFRAFGLEVPNPKDPYYKVSKLKLEGLAQFAHLRQELQSEHKIHLYSKFNQGYLVAPVKEQVSRAVKEGAKLMKRGLRLAIQGVINTDTSRLDYDGRKEHAEAIARMSFLQQAHKKAASMKFPPPPELE